MLQNPNENCHNNVKLNNDINLEEEIRRKKIKIFFLSGH